MTANMDGLIGRMALVNIDGKQERCEIVGWQYETWPRLCVIDPRHGGLRWVSETAVAVEARL